MLDKYQFNTIAVTGTSHSDAATGATNVPIYLSNAYHFPSADVAAARFNLEEGGYIYSRLNNPTVVAFEERVAALEGGVAAVATASGQFSEVLVFLSLCQQGDEIVCADNIYGGSLNLLGHSFKKIGIHTTFVKHSDLDAWERAITDKTKAFYLESISNPNTEIPDFEAIVRLAQRYGIPVVVDNTAATPYLFKPADYGVNVVLHSATKYLCGNGSVLGGVAVDIGNFDWEKSDRFKEFCQPDVSYHHLEFTKTFGPAALAAKMRCTVLRDYGGALSPFNAFILLQGLQTLPLRLERHVENNLKLVDFLLHHSDVESVSHPSLASHSSHELAKKYFPKGVGGLLTFKVKGGYERAKEFIDSVQLCVHAANIGDSRTIVTHPASTTHRQCTEEELKKIGITNDLVRVSVGIEDAVDIIQDIQQALRKTV